MKIGFVGATLAVAHGMPCRYKFYLPKNDNIDYFAVMA